MLRYKVHCVKIDTSTTNRRAYTTLVHYNCICKNETIKVALTLCQYYLKSFTSTTKEII